jgi:hypothetical protein
MPSYDERMKVYRKFGRGHPNGTSEGMMLSKKEKPCSDLVLKISAFKDAQTVPECGGGFTRFFRTHR